MEGILDDDPVNTAAGGGAVPQPGPFTDLVAQFQSQRSAGGASAMAGGQMAGAVGGYGMGVPPAGMYGQPGVGMYGQQQQQFQQPAQYQQQPVMDWGPQGFNHTQAAALAHMTGAPAPDLDSDANRLAKRMRMQGGGHVHAAGSTNQLQDLAGGWPPGGGGMVEGNDLASVYQAARAQALTQQQQQPPQQQYGHQAPAYGAGLPGLGELPFGDAPISSLGPAELQSHLTQPQVQPGTYNVAGGRLAGAPPRRAAMPTAPQHAGSRLTTGHKHTEAIASLMASRFNATPAVASAHHLSSARGSYQYGGGYQYQGVYDNMPASHAADGDQLLSKCEAVSVSQRGCRTHRRCAVRPWLAFMAVRHHALSRVMHATSQRDARPHAVTRVSLRTQISATLRKVLGGAGGWGRAAAVCTLAPRAGSNAAPPDAVLVKLLRVRTRCACSSHACARPAPPRPPCPTAAPLASRRRREQGGRCGAPQPGGAR
jgi:hypothetical protein